MRIGTITSKRQCLIRTTEAHEAIYWCQPSLSLARPLVFDRPSNWAYLLWTGHLLGTDHDLTVCGEVGVDLFRLFFRFCQNPRAIRLRRKGTSASSASLKDFSKKSPPTSRFPLPGS